MNLRIHRTYTWELIIADSDLNSRVMMSWNTQRHKLVATDVLEYFEDRPGYAHHEWKPVPIVEDAKPPHPSERVT